MSVLGVIRILFRLLWRAGVVYLCALAVFISCYITFLQQDVGLPVSIVLVLVLFLTALSVYAWTQNNIRRAKRKVAVLLKQEPLSGLIQYGFKQVEDNLVHTIRGMEVTLLIFPGNKKSSASITISFTAHAPFNSPAILHYSGMDFLINRVASYDEIFTVIKDFEDKYNAQQLNDFCYETVGFLKRQGYTHVAQDAPQDLSHFR